MRSNINVGRSGRPAATTSVLSWTLQSGGKLSLTASSPPRQGLAGDETNNGKDADTMMNAIEWPQGYLPGTTDNFVSNEVILAGLTAADIWPFLAEAPRWPSYYANSANVRVHGGDGLTLALGRRFSFDTFGGSIDAEVVEYVAPADGVPGRIAWHGWGGEGDDRLDVHHAWLVEDLDGGRVRILTQESQNGAPARELAAALPNPMLNGHQMWLDGLTAAARGKSGDRPADAVAAAGDERKSGSWGLGSH